MTSSSHTQFILGLDLGVASVGWALLQAEQDPETSGWIPVGLERLGVRVFDPGTEGTPEQIAKGRDESRGQARRAARGLRRNIQRRAARLRRLYRLLSERGFLPELPTDDRPEFLRRDEALKHLDRSILDRNGRRQDSDWATKSPYLLRALALEQALLPHELGRALYHLAQRRGFKSNRKAAPKADEKPGELELEFQRTREALQGERSLGAWLAKQDPHEARIRTRHHQRQMLEQEFEAIWAAQTPHHEALRDPDFRAAVHHAIFYQRPLKSAAHLIGWCSLEKGAWVTFTNKKGKLRRVYRAPRRAPKAHPLAQRFRLLQKVNDLELWFSDGRKAKPTSEQRQALLERLSQGDLKPSDAKKLLGLGRFDRINLLTEGEQKSLPGDRTAEKLLPILGPERWQALNPEARERLVGDLLRIEDADALRQWAETHWKLDPQTALALAKVRLEDGYIDLSLKAIRKLLPHLEAGWPYATARAIVYGPDRAPEAEDSLPPVPMAFPALRNPLVARTLTELRKVMNAILKRYGKPVTIRIELARDIKRSREDRKQLSNRIEKLRKEREAAWKAIQQECEKAGIALPKGRKDAEEKWLLWEECGGVCPYTGHAISFHQLFVTGEVEVEHIIPYSRSLDDSFQNKTLCFRRANQAKGDRLPSEAFSDQQLAEILQRIEAWDPKKAPARAEKLRRFRLKPEELTTDFTSSQLNDTAYASRLAQQYLGRLYGGLSDAEGHRRIQASKGQVTAILRRALGLEGFLGASEGPKNRDDHRHHALDALVIALTSPGTLQALSRLAQQNALAQARELKLPAPWENFREDVQRNLDDLNVSFRQDKRSVNGRLHEATFYRRGSDGRVYVREALTNLSAKDIPLIRNDGVRKAVEAALERAQEPDPKKAFKDPAKLPYLEGSKGKRIPIRKVTVEVSKSLIQVGENDPTRWTPADGNHHVAVVAQTDARGRATWRGHVVTRKEALDRHRKGLPIVARPEGFVMSLSKGDLLRWYEKDAHGNEVEKLFLIRSVYGDENSYIEGHDPRDARDKETIKKDHRFVRKSLAQLMALKAEKVLITPMGDLRRCRD